VTKLESRVLGGLGNMFRCSPDDARKALGALFGDNRLRIKPDLEQGFSVSWDALLCFGGTGDRTRPEHSAMRGATTVCIPVRLEL
jgi:hypothetical protein